MSNHLRERSSAVQLCHSAPLPHNGKRKRRSQDRDMVKSGGVDSEWTEHVSSSSGRTYFYNKKLDMSQWETPKGMVKR